MGQAIGDILPLAIGIAISPIPIIAVILMLMTPRARKDGLAFLGGWAGGLLVVGVIVLVVAGVAGVSSSSGPSKGAAVIKLALGLVLLALAVRQWHGRPAPGEESSMPKWMKALDSFTPPRAAAVAALLSGVNPKNLILNVGACVDIAQTGLPGVQQFIVLLVLVVVASIGVIIPIAVYFAMGAGSDRVLGEWKAWLAQDNATVMAVLFVVFGVALVGKGIAGLG